MCFRIRILIAILAVYATLLESIRRTGFYFILSIEFKNQSSNGLTNLLNSPDHFSIILSRIILYAISGPIVGRLADAYGGKWIIFMGAIIPLLLIIITIPLTNLFQSLTPLFVNIIIVEFFYAFTYAAMFSLFDKWFPSNEIPIANALIAFGGSLGQTIILICASNHNNWDISLLYILTVIHVPFILFWAFMVSNDPKTSNRIYHSERLYLNEKIEKKVISSKIQAPWLRMLFSIPVHCSIITRTFHSIAYCLLYITLYYHLRKVQLLSLWIPINLIHCITILIAPILAKLLIFRYSWERFWIRKFFHSWALLGPAICLIFIFLIKIHLSGLISTQLVPLEDGMVSFFLLPAFIFNAFYTTGEWTIVSEYAPNFSGTVFGLTNGLAHFLDIIMPYLIITQTLMNENEIDDFIGGLANWTGFITIITSGLISFIVFLIFSNDSQQSWDRKAVQQFWQLQCLTNQSTLFNQKQQVQMDSNEPIYENDFKI